MVCLTRGTEISCKNYNEFKVFEHSTNFYSKLFFKDTGSCDLYHHYLRIWSARAMECIDGLKHKNNVKQDLDFENTIDAKFTVILTLVMLLIVGILSFVGFKKREGIKNIFGLIVAWARAKTCVVAVKTEAEPKGEWEYNVALENLECAVKMAEEELMDSSTITGEICPYLAQCDRAVDLVEEMKIKNERKLEEKKARIQSLRSCPT